MPARHPNAVYYPRRAFGLPCVQAVSLAPGLCAANTRHVSM